MNCTYKGNRITKKMREVKKTQTKTNKKMKSLSENTISKFHWDVHRKNEEKK